MKKIKYVLIIFTMLLSLPIFSQTDIPAELSGFIPQGYSVVSYSKGNLNLDKLDDVILVLAKKGEDSLCNSENPMKRKTLILLEKDKQSYMLASQNENAVYYYNYDLNFKEALVDVTIKDGTFSIGHYGGFTTRWGRSCVFKYDPKAKNWYLFKDEFSSFKSIDAEGSEKKTVLTPENFGKISFSDFNIYKEVKLN